MRRMLVGGLGAAVALVGAIVATPVFGVDNGTVSATVTAVAPCITLSATSVSFPSAKFSTATQNNTSNAAVPDVSNCTTVPENIMGSASDATGTGPTSWTLAAPSGPAFHCAAGGALLPNNKFALFHTGGVGDERFLATSAAMIKSGLAGSGTMANYNFNLFMPCTGSGGAGVQMSFNVYFTAIIP